MCADKQFNPDVGSTKLFFREIDNGKLNGKSDSDFKGPNRGKTTQSPRFGLWVDLMFLRQPITV